MVLLFLLHYLSLIDSTDTDCPNIARHSDELCKLGRYNVSPIELIHAIAFAALPRKAILEFFRSVLHP